jgi:hypothetical protein
MLTIAWNSFGFHFLGAFPKGRFLRPSTAVIIFSQNCFRFARRSMEEDPSFILTMRDPRQLEHVELCIASRLAIHPPYLSDFATSDFFLFEHAEHCPQGMMFPSHEELPAVIRETVAVIPKRSCRAYLNIGWRDWNQRLRITVTTIHKLNKSSHVAARSRTLGSRIQLDSGHYFVTCHNALNLSTV